VASIDSVVPASGRVSARLGLPPLTAQAALDAMHGLYRVDGSGRWCIETERGLLFLQGAGLHRRRTAACPFRVVPAAIAVRTRRGFARPVPVEMVLDVWSRRACELALYPVPGARLRSSARNARVTDAGLAAVCRLVVEMEHWALHNPANRMLTRSHA
jgi:hypothetical protein